MTTPLQKIAKLPPKQLLFVEEFLKDFNGTQAAIRAGYDEDRARQTAYDLLTKRDISELIETRKAELMAARKMTLEKWVDLVTKLALYDPRKLFDAHGNPTEIPELKRLSALAVVGYEIEELFDGRGEDRKKIGYARKVKLLDRTPYIMALGKYLNAFPLKQVAVAPSHGAQYDPSKLTKDEWAEYQRIRKKALIQIEEQKP